MIRRFIGGMFVAAFLSGATGCGSPFLHPAANASSEDPGLVGEWSAAEPLQMRAAIAPSQDSTGKGYAASLTVHDKGEFKAALTMDLTLTDIGDNRYADLYLARPERDKLVGSYGFLVVPVHQVMKITREGDILTVWQFRGDWLDGHADRTALWRDHVAVGGGEVVMITAPTEQVRNLIARHADAAGAFGDPIVFHRMKH